LHVNPSFNYKSFLSFFLFRKVGFKETQYYNYAALSHFNILLCLITLNKSVLKIITIKHQCKAKADGNSKQSSTKKETQKTNFKNVCSVVVTAAPQTAYCNTQRGKHYRVKLAVMSWREQYQVLF